MSNASIAPRKERGSIGASFLVLLKYFHPDKLISDRYYNKENCDAISGIIITRREVMRVTRREQICIFINHKYLEYHEFHCVQMLVRFIREGIETHVFKDS